MINWKIFSYSVYVFNILFLRKNILTQILSSRKDFVKSIAVSI